jgi:hypothetical protein
MLSHQLDNGHNNLMPERQEVVVRLNEVLPESSQHSGLHIQDSTNSSHIVELTIISIIFNISHKLPRLL